MKSLFTLTALVLLLNIYWCSSDNNDLYNKEKCVSYSTKIVEEWQNNKNDKSFSMNNIKEIFYSSSLNSCLYVVHETSSRGIYDFLNKTTILEKASPLSECIGEQNNEACGQTIEDEFERKIEELK